MMPLLDGQQALYRYVALQGNVRRKHIGCCNTMDNAIALWLSLEHSIYNQPLRAKANRDAQVCEGENALRAKLVGPPPLLYYGEPAICMRARC